MTTPTSPDLHWRTSSWTTSGNSCVEVAGAGDTVAVRNSVHPGAGTLHVTRRAFAALLDAVRAGALDDLA
jgi:hypothetical protein